jgi:hypothetical protein
VDVGGQESFQVGIIYEAQGDVEGGERIEGLGVIQVLGTQVAILGTVTGFGGRRQVRIEGETQG